MEAQSIPVAGAWTDAEGAARARTLLATLTDAAPAWVWAAPGRVNLIGEHTDYNAGLALPFALPHRTFVAFAPRTDGRVRLTSDFAGGAVTWSGDVADIGPGRVPGWVGYAAGPAWALREEGLDVGGFDAAIVSCVPLGAGLSSSAAVECAIGLALADAAGEPLDGDDAARSRLAWACVRAENEVAGAPTGGMDQAASLRSRAGHALLLDFRDGTATPVPFDPDAAGLALLVIDTRWPHALVDGQYADRRRTCEEAADLLGLPSLREIDGLDAALDRLPTDAMRRRVRHVVTEIRRTSAAVAALWAQNWTDLGDLMTASHESLRDDYEVSVRALDAAVEASLRAGALGARMTGGGFGGCAIALVPASSRDQVAASVLAAAPARGCRRRRSTTWSRPHRADGSPSRPAGDGGRGRPPQGRNAVPMDVSSTGSRPDLIAANSRAWSASVWSAYAWA